MLGWWLLPPHTHPQTDDPHRTTPQRSLSHRHRRRHRHTLVCVWLWQPSSKQQERAQHALLAYAQPTKLTPPYLVCCESSEQRSSSESRQPYYLHPPPYPSSLAYLIDRPDRLDRETERQPDHMPTHTHTETQPTASSTPHTRNETGSSLGHTAPVWPAPTREIALE